jgi:threonine-phosphate decarboxylase
MVIAHGGAVYATARARGWHWRDTLDFSASINPLGPAPGVRDAITSAIDRVVHYPDPYASCLVRLLAERWNVDADCILAGNGATDLIHFFARTFGAGEVTLVVPTFSEFHRAWPDARLVTHHDRWPSHGLLVLTNPNNPMGCGVVVPDRCGPTLVDESFIEFTDLPTCIGRGMFVLRSLTKFQALPGLRLGALIGPADAMRALRAVREPWQVNVLAEAAGFVALQDPEHARRTREYVASERASLMESLSDLRGVRPMRSLANYICCELDYPAHRLSEFLLHPRILVRDCSGMPGITGEAVRIAVRTREENQKLIAAWRQFQCD